MENNVDPTQSDWRWQSGVSYLSVTYEAQTDTAETKEAGELTWIEEISPEDDDRGNGSCMTSTQPLADFLKKGPHSNPPVVIVEAMLAAFQAQKPSWLGPYRLLQAAISQDVAAVGAMLDQGVAPDATLNGLTPFYWAVHLQNHAMADRLFAAGVDVNRHFPGSDETILTTIAYSDETWEPLAARIIAQGADLDARSRWGVTILMNAAGSRNRWLVTLLLKLGADVNTVSTHGYTALMDAVGSRYAPVEMVEELLTAGADVNAQDKEGWSALMRAISHSMVEGVRCLIQAGANVHIVNAPTQQYREPKSVLQLAIDYANPEIIAMLREAGAA